MTPYLIYAVAPNGHFVGVREIMAFGDAAAIKRARQLLDQFDLEVWNGGKKIGRLSARRRARSVVILWREWISLIKRPFTSLAC